jgi:hypothetical protein
MSYFHSQNFTLLELSIKFSQHLTFCRLSQSLKSKEPKSRAAFLPIMRVPTLLSHLQLHYFTFKLTTFIHSADKGYKLWVV